MMHQTASGHRRVEYGRYGVQWWMADNDGKHAVLFFHAPGDPGRYSLFDRRAGELRDLPPQYPGLDPTVLGASFSTRYEARDGLKIPAYVTLPAGITTMADIIS